MMEAIKAPRPKEEANRLASYSTRLAAPRSVSRPRLLMLLLAGLIAGLSSQARADPTADRVFFECTFTTGSSTTAGTLNSVLNISSLNLSKLDGNQIQASYILIYVRQNPNDGQDLKNSTSFTGPILCRNSNTAVIPTTEDTLIPDSGLGADSVNITSAEEVSHLQYEPNFGTTVGAREKRVCHTVASNTDCFIIRPQP